MARLGIGRTRYEFASSRRPPRYGLDDVARTGEPLLVTRRGKPLARISPSVDASSGYPQDTLAGTVVELDDIVAPAVPRGQWLRYAIGTSAFAFMGVHLADERPP
jgi:antitoxin (DNA-binding transcriptional repressor) of toxin-antitoxin stability system